jgi:hypothetical protein
MLDDVICRALLKHVFIALRILLISQNGALRCFRSITELAYHKKLDKFNCLGFLQKMTF